MPKTVSPPWITPLHVGIVLASLTTVLLAATFQHVVVIGYAPEGRFYVVPSLVGLFFGFLLVMGRRIVVVNRTYGRALAERNEQIETLNRELEDRVSARTEELSVKHEQLLQAQRMEMVRQLVGGVAHDLNNLLMVIRGNADLLNVGDQDTPLINDIFAATERSERLVKSLLRTSGRGRISAHVPLDQLVDELAGLLERAFGNGYSIDVEHDTSPAAVVEAARVEQILLNLLVNARDAQPGGGHMLVRTAAGDSGGVVLEVEDSGPGVPAEIRDRIFETFFTTKPEGAGSGLGLSTVHLLVHEAGGTIELRPGAKGACFRVALPAIEIAEPMPSG